MNILDFIDLNDRFLPENKFTENQQKEIVNNSFSMDKNLNAHVTLFYTEYLGFDMSDCIDLIMDIQNRDGDAFERFIDDILYYGSI